MADFDMNEMLMALMPKSKQLVVEPPPEMNELDPNEPTGFDPEQIIYRKVVPVGQFRCRYAFIDKPTPIDENFDFDLFVRNAATGAYVPNDFMLPEDDPLGILVKKDSYIFLHLDERLPTFEHNPPGVALGSIARPQESLYGDLHYVADNGEWADAAFPNCHLVFFKARHWRNPNDNPPHIQKFWFGLSSDVWVDPDVRYPGNGTE